MRPYTYIEASNYDEAVEKIYEDEDLVRELLIHMITERKSYVTIEYGECRPIVVKGNDDYDCVDLGEVEIELEEIVTEFGGIDALEIIAEYYEEKLKEK